MTQILNSAPVRKKIRKELKQECKFLKENGVIPYLKVVVVGNDPASLIYVTHKKKFCERIGALCDIVALDEKVELSAFLKTIDEINSDDKVDGCIIQLPLPKQLSQLDVGKLVTAKKDVDGFHPENLYAVLSNTDLEKHFISCTPKGIITLLTENNFPIEGKNVVIIGRSMIVGRPLACLFTNLNATVTLCHSKTVNIKEITKRCDILVSAIGVPKFIDETYISSDKKQILIDVGMNLDDAGELCGDMDFLKIQDLVFAITPVPGGVGPMTIVSLAQNLLQASKKRLSV